MGMNTLGLPFAVEPKIRPSSVMPRPQVLLFVERRNSSSSTWRIIVTVKTEAEEALAE